VVHTHSGVWYKASLAARRAGVPYLIHTDHGRQSPDRLPHRVVDGLASRRTDAIIAVSSTLARQLAETVVHDPSRVRVIRNGIDTERFRSGGGTGTVRVELGLQPEVPIIGSIGRLDPIKRFDLMILAFKELVAEWHAGPPPVLVIAGDGPERGRLEALIAAHRLAGRAHLLGWRDDIQELHAAFTLFTLSSRSEGTSIGLLEAMSAEVCPVVTDVGGNADVLGSGLRHRLCPPENPVALRQAWESALGDPTRLRLDGAAARHRVEDAFSLHRMIGEYERLYSMRKIAGSKTDTPPVIREMAARARPH
jgi:glycosyltransferase involved in cell wall biosynthesis